MDPVTHALLGASAGYVAFGKRLGPRAAAVGALAALLPDADVLIRSASDPLLAIEHHRGFTHALAFAPIGGVAAALPWLATARGRQDRGAIVGAAVLGYLTHGPLDAATSYGTRLLWPVSDARVGLDLISIIDPLFTLLLLVGLAVSLVRGARAPVAAALVLCALYLGAGAVQHTRTMDAQLRIAAARGQTVERGAAFPTFGNNLVRRSIYQASDSLYLDRIRVSWRGDASWMPSDAIPVLRATDGNGGASLSARHRRDLRRFAWFSDGWIAHGTDDPTVIGDARYSMELDRWVPVWGIRLHGDGRVPPTEWVDRSRERRIDGRAVRAEVFGRHPAYRAVPAYER